MYFLKTFSRTEMSQPNFAFGSQISTSLTKDDLGFSEKNVDSELKGHSVLHSQMVWF